VESASEKTGDVWSFCSACGGKFAAGSGLISCPRDNAPLINMLDDPLVGVTLSLRYEILELIGIGAWSRVYRARQIALNRNVAVKVLHAQSALDETRLKRFEQEAKLASTIKHPNVIDVLDFGLHPQPFIVMEFLDGETLSYLIKQKGALPLPEATHIFEQICGALVAAHSKGLIHRDLKPANIMLTKNVNGTALAKVLDFGLAKIISEDAQTLTQLTTTGQLLGSPAYMSPEQCTGGKLDARSDIYSLGCMMYEALTGKVAFEADSANECMRMHLSAFRPSLTAARKDLQLPASVEGIVLRAIAVEPVERYQSAADLKSDLESVAAGKIEGFLYSRTSLPAILSRGRRFLRRPYVRFAVLSLFLALVALTVVYFNRENIIGAAWQYQYEAGKHALSQDKPEEAFAKLQSALKLAQFFGSDNWRTTRTMVQLRNAYKAAKTDRLASEFDHRISALAQGGPDSQIILLAAARAEKVADYTRAEKLLNGLILKQRQSPSESLALAASLGALIDTYAAEGKFTEAEAAARESLEARKKYLDQNDPLLTTSIKQLAEVCWLQGRYDEAQELLEEVVSLKRRELGPSHPEVAEAISGLGAIRQKQGDLPGAEKLLKEAVDILDKAPNRANFDIGPIYGNLAVLYAQTQRYKEADSLYQQSLAEKTKRYGRGSPATCEALTNLGLVRYAEGRVDEALPYLKKALDIRLKTFGESNPYSQASIINYARVLRSRDPSLAAKYDALAEKVRAKLAEPGAGP
jgi:serine/threonine protein kinase